jgi:hypothetical protein
MQHEHGPATGQRDPPNCDQYSLVGLSADQLVWVWFVHRDVLRRQKLPNGTMHKNQIWCKGGNSDTESRDMLQTACMQKVLPGHKHFVGLSVYKRAKLVWIIILTVDDRKRPPARKWWIQ